MAVVVAVVMWIYVYICVHVYICRACVLSFCFAFRPRLRYTWHPRTCPPPATESCRELIETGAVAREGQWAPSSQLDIGRPWNGPPSRRCGGGGELVGEPIISQHSPSAKTLLEDATGQDATSLEAHGVMRPRGRITETRTTSSGRITSAQCTRFAPGHGVDAEHWAPNARLLHRARPLAARHWRNYKSIMVVPEWRAVELGFADLTSRDQSSPRGKVR